jgi:hypothetical protein
VLKTSLTVYILFYNKLLLYRLNMKAGVLYVKMILSQLLYQDGI